MFPIERDSLPRPSVGDKEKYIAKITNFCQFKQNNTKKISEILFECGLNRMVTKGGGALSVRRAPRVLGINRVMEINVMSRSAGD